MSADSWSGLAWLVAENCHEVFGVTAFYFAAGNDPGVPVSLVIHPAAEEVDLPGTYGGSRFAARGRRVELLASQVPAPTAGDELRLQDGSDLCLRLQGEPRREAERTLWLCDAHEVSDP